MIEFTVYGEAKTKGSKTAGRTKDGRGYVYEPKTSRDWEMLVAIEAQKHAADGLLTGPLMMTLRYYLPKPKSAPKTRRVWPAKKPDIDKLDRAILDALKGRIYEDDAQIVGYDEHFKDYAEPGQAPRVEIRVRQLTEEAAS